MRFLFLILDFIVFFTITTIITNIRSTLPLSTESFLSIYKVMFPVFVLNVILLLIFSFYDLKNTYKKHSNSFVELLTAFIVSFIISAAGIYFTATIFNLPTPKTNLLLILLIFYIYVFLLRKIYYSLHLFQTKTILLGNSKTLNKIKETLQLSPKYKIVYNFKDISEIPQNLDTNDIDLIIVSNVILEQFNNPEKTIFNKFISNGIQCFTDLFYFEHIFSRLPEETLSNITCLIKDINHYSKSSVYLLTKRFFDILFVICLTPIIIPLGIIIYFLILVIDKQNPIFFQERAGFEGKPIQVCKFRTLIKGTESPTKIGIFLRKYRLDEIPQLINILDGNISIVGPRPLQIEDNLLLNKYVSANSLRNLIKPGLTGWAQLNFKAPCNYSTKKTPNFKNDIQKNEYFKDAITRLSYDIWYIKNASFLLDIEIMFKTAKRAFIKDKKLIE